MLAGLIFFRSAVVRSSLPRVSSSWIRASAGISTLSDDRFPSKPSPYLMLPTAFKGGDLVYSFYSPAEDRTLSFRSLCPAAAAGGKLLIDDNAVVVGTGHGWLATFNAYGNHDLFLSHPISGRHIKLPAMIPTPPELFRGPANDLWNLKLIFSSSPDEEECRAVMSIYGLELTALAYCLPGRSTEWAPLCDLVWGATNFVYSRRQQCFICISAPRIGIESWYLSSTPQPPRMVDCFKEELEFDYKNCPWSREETDQLQEVQYVVLEEDSDNLYIVRRFMESDTDDFCSWKTIGFLVFKVERDERKAVYTSVGPTMFLGSDRSYALSSSAEFPLLKPNSLYFTCPTAFRPVNGRSFIDVGIHDYGRGTTAHYHCPFDVEGVRLGHLSGPVWFTPSNH